MLDASDKFGRSALHLAVESGSIEIAQLILASRARLLEAETTRGETPRELATALRQRAQTELSKSRYVECWSRRLVAKVTDEALVAMELELERREAMEQHLVQCGASGTRRRATIKLGRWCLLFLSLPWFVLHTTVVTTVLAAVCPTLREAAVAMHNFGGCTRLAVAYVLLMLLLAGVSVFSFFGMNEREQMQLLVLSCVAWALLSQAIVSCRILAECRCKLFQPQPRATVALFHNGFEMRSTIWLVLVMMELPQQAALAFVGATDGWVWNLPLLSASMFDCIDHENCASDLRNITEHGIDFQQACDNDFCVTCVRSGQCDAACGYCATMILGMKPFELMFYVASAAALAWVCTASVIGISFGLGCTGPLARSNFPRIRADTWRMPSQDVVSHIFCHTLYTPVMMSLLRVADCRAMSADAVLNATGAFPWLTSDWDAQHQWHEDTAIECWSDAHALFLVPSMVLMVGYHMLTGVLPVMLQQSVPYGRVTVAVPYTFDCVSRSVKLLMVLSAVFSAASTGGPSGHLVATCSALAGNLLLILVTLIWPPSEHRTMRRLRLVIYCTASWVAATAVCSALICSREMVEDVSFFGQSSAVDYYNCHPSNVALAVGMLIAFAVSYHALESVTGLPPFARIARGARPSKLRATRIIPASSPSSQPIKHGTWLGKLIGNFEASHAAAVASSNESRRSLAYMW
jgi:hypothetical protein